MPSNTSHRAVRSHGSGAHRPRAPAALGRAVLDLVLPASCASCGQAGGPWCHSCVRSVLGELVAFDGPRWVRPDPVPPGFPRCRASAAYGGPLARSVTAFKDQDRRDLGPPLALLLARSVAGYLDGPRRQVWLVPAPGSATATRRRGRDPAIELARLAVTMLSGSGRRSDASVVAADLLVQCRRVADQSGLGAVARAVNLSGALDLRPRTPLAAGQAVILVDDVVTTGATLAESARVLRSAGALVLGAATVCATQRQSDGSSPMVPSGQVG